MEKGSEDRDIQRRFFANNRRMALFLVQNLVHGDKKRLSRSRKNSRGLYSANDPSIGLSNDVYVALA